MLKNDLKTRQYHQDKSVTNSCPTPLKQTASAVRAGSLSSAEGIGSGATDSTVTVVVRLDVSGVALSMCSRGGNQKHTSSNQHHSGGYKDKNISHASQSFINIRLMDGPTHFSRRKTLSILTMQAIKEK